MSFDEIRDWAAGCIFLLQALAIAAFFMIENYDEDKANRQQNKKAP